MQKYPVDPLELLTEAQLDEVMGYSVPMEERNRENIQQRFAKATLAIPAEDRPTKTKRRVKKGTVLLAAALVVFGLVGFTNFDRITQLFASHLGNKNLGQYAVPIEESCEDQGIRMEVLTGLNSGSTTFLFVDLTDETGQNRLDETLWVDQWDMEVGKEIGGGNCRLVEWDQENGKATLMVSAIGGKPGTTSEFSINRLFTKEYKYEDICTDDNLQSMLSSADKNPEFEPMDPYFSGGISPELMEKAGDDPEVWKYTPQVVLEQDALALEIPGYEKGYFSNLAYADGYLHLQFNPDNDPGNEALFVDLKNTKTGEVLSPYYSVQYGDYQYDGLTYGNDFVEFVFQVDNFQDLENYVIQLSGWYYQEVMEGDWLVSITVPGVMESRRIPDPLLEEKELPLSNVYISPLGLLCDVNAPMERLEVWAVQLDGTRKQICDERLTGLNEYSPQMEFVAPLQEFDQLVTVEINGIPFEING